MAKKKKRLNTSLLFMPVSIIIISLIFIHIFSSYTKIVRTKRETAAVKKQLVELKKEEDKLNNDVKKLSDPEYLEKYLREKYHYSKEGEYIIKIPKKEV